MRPLLRPPRRFFGPSRYAISSRIFLFFFAVLFLFFGFNGAIRDLVSVAIAVERRFFLLRDIFRSVFHRSVDDIIVGFQCSSGCEIDSTNLRIDSK